jgi:glutamate carboxypeptidase
MNMMTLDDLSPEQVSRAFQYLASRQAVMTQTLERWCNQNSGSYHPAGLAAMSEMLCEDYATLGHGPRRTTTPPFTTVEDDGSTRHHQTADLIRWDFGEEASRRLLLMIHYDTVYPPDSEPSRVRITPEHRMIGPGTADAKGGLLIMLEALAAVRQFELDDGIGWTAVANPDRLTSNGRSRR